MGVVTWVVYYGLFAITKRPSISMLIAILIAIVVYLIAFVVVTGTTEAEMRRMPMGTKLVKFCVSCGFTDKNNRRYTLTKKIRPENMKTVFRLGSFDVQKYIM